MVVFNKFIIEYFDDEKCECLIISRCTYHRDVAYNINNVKSGGWYNFDSETRTFTLYGSSEQFGKADFNDIKNCILNKKLFTNYTLINNLTDKFKFVYRDENVECMCS